MSKCVTTRERENETVYTMQLQAYVVRHIWWQLMVLFLRKSIQHTHVRKSSKGNMPRANTSLNVRAQVSHKVCVSNSRLDLNRMEQAPHLHTGAQIRINNRLPTNTRGKWEEFICSLHKHMMQKPALCSAECSSRVRLAACQHMDLMAGGAGGAVATGAVVAAQKSDPRRPHIRRL